MTWHLATGELRRIDSVERVSQLTVIGGCVWLTATPADADIVLRTGDSWHPNGDWPVVVQAVAPATIELMRGDAPACAAVGRPYLGELIHTVQRRARAWRRRMAAAQR